MKIWLVENIKDYPICRQTFARLFTVFSFACLRLNFDLIEEYLNQQINCFQGISFDLKKFQTTVFRFVYGKKLFDHSKFIAQEINQIYEQITFTFKNKLRIKQLHQLSNPNNDRGELVREKTIMIYESIVAQNNLIKLELTHPKNVHIQV